jgi:hypothetical protein
MSVRGFVVPVNKKLHAWYTTPTWPCAVSAYETITRGVGNMAKERPTKRDASFFILFVNTNLFNSRTKCRLSFPQMPLQSHGDAGIPYVTTPTSASVKNKPNAKLTDGIRLA